MKPTAVAPMEAASLLLRLLKRQQISSGGSK